MKSFMHVFLLSLALLCLCAAAQALTKSGYEVEPPVPELSLIHI